MIECSSAFFVGGSQLFIGWNYRFSGAWIPAILCGVEAGEPLFAAAVMTAVVNAVASRHAAAVARDAAKMQGAKMR
ncbi:hypothetical protein TcWFU_000762 [Taenia crassiceps]|uniref:Uncharacterized protein n=1 Tax=Taenia crassiceps TaxID=6207 RepID=A0ABR4Q7H5_9CEST